MSNWNARTPLFCRFMSFLKLLRGNFQKCHLRPQTTCSTTHCIPFKKLGALFNTKTHYIGFFLNYNLACMHACLYRSVIRVLLIKIVKKMSVLLKKWWQKVQKWLCPPFYFSIKSLGGQLLLRKVINPNVFKGQVFVAVEGGYSHKTEKLFYLGGSNSSRQCIFVASSLM